MGRRYYSPGTGRFLTRDPLGYGGGVNLYGFTANNPVNGMDPDGLSPGGDEATDYLDGGQRAWKGDASSRTYFLYDGDKVACEETSAGALINTDGYGPAGLVQRYVQGIPGYVGCTFDPQGTVVQRHRQADSFVTAADTAGLIATLMQEVYLALILRVYVLMRERPPRSVIDTRHKNRVSPLVYAENDAV